MDVSETQMRWFRFRRSGLAEPFAAPATVASRLLGVQAQMPVAGDIAFFNRLKKTSQAELQAARLESRSVVRFWGQRNTVHIFAAADWPLLHAAFQERSSVLQRKLEQAGLGAEFLRLASRLEKRLRTGGTLTYGDVKSKKLEEKQDKWVLAYAVFMHLVRRGTVCHGADQDNRSSFVHRDHWLPELTWEPPGEERATTELAARYLATFGPATPADLAFWYGTTLTNARRWIASDDRNVEVMVAGRPHFCRAEDLSELTAKAPVPSRWPVHLLHRFDPLVLATKDKNWLIDPAHYKKVWRAAAHVEAVLLVGGRIAGTWRYDRKSRGIVVNLSPFSRLAKTVTRSAEKRARALAGFLDVELLDFRVG